MKIWHTFVKAKKTAVKFSSLFRWCSSSILIWRQTFAETQFSDAISFDISKCIMVYKRERKNENENVNTNDCLDFDSILAHKQSTHAQVVFVNAQFLAYDHTHTNTSVQQCVMWMLWSSNRKCATTTLGVWHSSRTDIFRIKFIENSNCKEIQLLL